jgi:hypothetical protein
MACPLLLRRSSAGGPELRRIAAATIRWRWNVDRVVPRSQSALPGRVAGHVYLRSRKVSGRISHPARYWINRASLCNALGASVGRSIRGVSVIGAAETSRVMVNWNARRRQTW